MKTVYYSCETEYIKKGIYHLDHFKGFFKKVQNVKKHISVGLQSVLLILSNSIKYGQIPKKFPSKKTLV